jgi:5-methylcytosine-specific restriction endonuclease McrA
LDNKRKARKRVVRQTIFARDSFTCQLCGWRPEIPEEWDGTTPLTDGKRTLTIDHIIEKALGGPSTIENFRAACDKCNVQRSIHVSKLIRQLQMAGFETPDARKVAALLLGLDT